MLTKGKKIRVREAETILKAIKQGPGQGWGTNPHTQYTSILPMGSSFWCCRQDDRRQLCFREGETEAREMSFMSWTVLF